MSSAISSSPLVSVGIPTYNRPKSLRHTLECITRQTYRNLEILVSDNASPDPEVEAVVREFMTCDPRVQYFRQPENIGIVPNYQFVLSRATGEFFMWAADDDDWDARFVEHCVTHIGGATSYMPGYRFVFTQTGKTYPCPPVTLSMETPRSVALRLFFQHWYVHILYALHRRESIQFVLSDPVLYNYDTYFSIRILLEGRVVVDPTKRLLTIIVETPEYEVKPMVRPGKKLEGYRNSLKIVSGLLLRTPHVPFFGRLAFISRWWDAVLKDFSGGEKATYPLAARLARLVVLVASLPERLRRHLCPSPGNRPS